MWVQVSPSQVRGKQGKFKQKVQKTRALAQLCTSYLKNSKSIALVQGRRIASSCFLFLFLLSENISSCVLLSVCALLD